MIQPICLPPYGPVDPRMINNGSISQFWYKEGMPLVPFEDMDCELDFAEKIQVPKATAGEVREAEVWPSAVILSLSPQTGWLKCNPKFSTETRREGRNNIAATRSFITGFGSIAYPIPLTGYIPYKYKRICRTNTFSPAMSMLK